MRGARACIVSRELAPWTRGGIGEVLRQRIELDRGGLPPIVLLDLPTRTVVRARASTSDGVLVHGVDELSPRGLPLHAFCSEAYWRSHRIWLALCRLVDEVPIHSIEFPDYEGLGFVSIKAARLGLSPELPPFVIRIHGTAEWTARADGRPLDSLQDRQRAGMERYSLRRADAVMAPSNALLDAYRQDYVLPEDVRIAPPLAPSRAALSNEFSSSAPPRLPLSIGFLGKLQPLKGPAVLVDAVVDLLCADRERKIEVQLVGGDEPGRFHASHLAELRARIPADLVDRFAFRGALPQMEALEWMSGCHAAILPSRMETFGLAAHELAALGLPLALSDIPAYREGFGPEARIERFAVDDVAGLSTIIAAWYASLEKNIWPPVTEARPALGPLVDIEPDADEPSKQRPCIVGSAAGSSERDIVRLRVDASGSDAPPRISVIVPYFEMHDYIDACLESIEQDEYSSKEILVIDDGSHTKAALQKLDSLQEQWANNPDRRVLSKPNGGLGSARNFGVERARGDLILPLDADDLIVSGYLAAAATALDRCPELAFVSCISSLFPDGGDPASEGDWIIPYDPDLAMLFYENGAGVAAAVFRRASLLRFRYREDLPAYEDWDLHLQLASAGESGEVLPVVFHRYRQRAKGLSRLAHRVHDRLLATILAPHLESLDPVVRAAFEIYLAETTRMRGLGGTWNARPKFLIRFADRVESFYRSSLKMWLCRYLGDEWRMRIVGWARRLLRGG